MALRVGFQVSKIILAFGEFARDRTNEIRPPKQPYFLSE